MKEGILAVTILAFVALAAPGYAQTTYVATLEERQVVGGTGSTATGTATAELSESETVLLYEIGLAGLDLDGQQTPMDPDDDVTALHFHANFPGANGPVAFGLINPNHDTDDLVIDPVAATLQGTWENTDVNPLSDWILDLKAGAVYLNVHTMAFPGGEIRGQMEPQIFADGFESGDTTVWSGSVP